MIKFLTKKLTFHLVVDFVLVQNHSNKRPEKHKFIFGKLKKHLIIQKLLNVRKIIKGIAIYGQ